MTGVRPKQAGGALLAAAYGALVFVLGRFPAGETLGPPVADAGWTLVLFTGAPSLLVGALLGRRAAAVALAAGLAAGVDDGMTLTALGHGAACAAVVGAGAAMRRDGTDVAAHAPFGRARTLAVAVLAAGAPFALGFGWWALDRPEPPAWGCFADRPPGHAEAADRWLAGAGPAIAAVTLVLVALAWWLSAWRLRREAGARRPGIPALLGGGALGAAVLRVAAERSALEDLDGTGLLLVFAAPSVLVLAIVTAIWIARRPEGLGSVAALEALVWTAAALTPGAAGASIVGAAVQPGLCL